jgi:hypothetical protein
VPSTELDSWTFEDNDVVHIPCCMWAEIYANEVRCMNCGERAPQTWIDVANLSGDVD